jgi:hypothetical protein
LKKTAGQQSALLGGGGAAAALYTEHDLEVFLSTEKGKKLVKAAAQKKQRKKSLSEVDKGDRVFKCWYCSDPGHRKYDCPVFKEDRKNVTVKPRQTGKSTISSKKDSKVEEANVADGEKSTESEEDGLGWIVFDDDTVKHEESGLFIDGDGFDGRSDNNVETVLAVFTEHTEIEVEKEDGYIMGDGLELHGAMVDDFDGRLDDSEDYSEEASDRIDQTDKSHEGCNISRDKTVGGGGRNVSLTQPDVPYVSEDPTAGGGSRNVSQGPYRGVLGLSLGLFLAWERIWQVMLRFLHFLELGRFLFFIAFLLLLAWGGSWRNSSKVASTGDQVVFINWDLE